jgi:hypothetical protein
MYNPKKYINGFLYFYVLLSWAFTFIIDYDFDKISVLLITSFLLVIVYEELKSSDDKKFFLRKTSNLNLFLVISIILYVGQLVNDDVVINKELLTLFSIYLTIVLLGKFKSIICFSNVFKLYGCLFLLSSILTIKQSPFAEFGYTFETGAGGILSSFLLFSVFLSLFIIKDHKFFKLISFFAVFLIMLFQIRGVVLSLIITYITHKGVNKVLLLYVLIGFILIFLLYILMPDSRLFSSETSGRVIHWEIIISKFEVSFLNVIFGMGDSFSTNVLLDHGVGEHMAAPHNEYIRYILDLGLLGFVLLFFIFKELYLKSENKFVILVLLQQMITDNIFTYFHNYLFFMILISMYNFRRQTR